MKVLQFKPKVEDLLEAVEYLGGCVGFADIAALAQQHNHKVVFEIRSHKDKTLDEEIIMVVYDSVGEYVVGVDLHEDDLILFKGDEFIGVRKKEQLERQYVHHNTETRQHRLKEDVKIEYYQYD